LCIVYASRYQLLKQSKQNRTFSEWWRMFAVHSY
jgi:hypothetical protein